MLGSKVEVLAQHGGWLEIPFQQGTAFISGRYVELYAQAAMQHGVVTASLLNVRLSPQSGATVIGQLSANSAVVITSTVGEWCEIPFNNGMGYIASRYVELRPDTEISAPSPVSTMLDDENDEDDDGGRVAHAGDEGREDVVRLTPVSQLLVAGTAEERKVAATWNRFGGLLAVLSEAQSIDVACALAVLCVESSGKGFEPGNQGLMIIRFENHKFWKYWGKNDPDRFRQHFSYQAGKVWKGHQWRKLSSHEWRTFHGSQRAEWEVLNFARSINNSAALKSISMGAPQIMGFNYEGLGYQSVEEMFASFCGGIEAQIRGMFDFMSPAMVQRLQRYDFEGFAGFYNGSGQKEKYGRWIKSHYDAYKRLA